MPRPFSAMVLAAGLGTRLRPLTDERPKPLVPVGDRPLLHSLVEELLLKGATNVVVNAHYLSDEIFSSLRYLGDKVHVNFEREIRGTAGGVAAARSFFRQEPVLVVNGDLAGELPVAPLIEAPDSAALLLGVLRRERPALGTVGVGIDGRVVRLRSASLGEEVRGADYIGVARLSPELVADLPEAGCLVGDVAIPRMLAGLRVGTLELEGPFWDIGSVDSYVEANCAWLRTAGLDDFRGEGAQVPADIQLHRVIVGAGARVLGSGRLERVIVWPSATVTAPLTDAIVTSSGRVVRTERSLWRAESGATT